MIEVIRCSLRIIVFSAGCPVRVRVDVVVTADTNNAAEGFRTDAKTIIINNMTVFLCAHVKDN